MDEYISRNELLKDVQSNVAEAHNERCAQLLEAILNAPTADVVPKSEVEKLVQDSTRLVQENETLKDNNEHLAVMLEEAKAEVGKLQNELAIWKQNRFNLFQRLECYEMARQKVASEIFAEIEKALSENFHADCQMGDCIEDYYDNNLQDDIAELKKKYTEGEQ